jgi:hypothetical protein
MMNDATMDHLYYRLLVPYIGFRNPTSGKLTDLSKEDSSPKVAHYLSSA